MSLIYKTLFEVKLFHEYHLTNANGETIFSRDAQKDRISFLEDEFSMDMVSINADIDFSFPENLAEVYKDYNLKLLSSYSGFKVAVRVIEEKLPDGTTLYKPLSLLPVNMCINILFSKNNYTIGQLTNSRINTTIPSLYFFSGNAAGSERSFPFLTSSISAWREDYGYEQGELAMALDKIYSYYRDGLGEQWKQVKGKGFANENDRVLLPLKFYYSFPSEKNNTKAVFELKDKNGNTLKKIIIENRGQIDKVLLDFSSEKGLPVLTGESALNGIVCTLTVTGDDEYFHVHPVIFSDDYYSKNVWAVACIQPVNLNSQFDLFDADGYIKKRKDPAGNWTEAPVFEIPVKSRFNYWRYSNNKGKKLQLLPELEDFLEKENDNLVSKVPRSIARSFLLLDPEEAEAKYFPNPENFDVKIGADKKMYYDILVPESANFPIV